MHTTLFYYGTPAGMKDVDVAYDTCFLLVILDFILFVRNV